VTAFAALDDLKALKRANKWLPQMRIDVEALFPWNIHTISSIVLEII